MYLAFLSLNLNKLMDAINQHYNLGMAKLTVQKKNTTNKHMITIFSKKYSYADKKELLKNILLIDQLSLDDMRKMKSKF